MSRLEEAVALLRRVSQDYHEAMFHHPENQTALYSAHTEERFEFCEDCDPKLRAFFAAHDAAPPDRSRLDDLIEFIDVQPRKSETLLVLRKMATEAKAERAAPETDAVGALVEVLECPLPEHCFHHARGPEGRVKCCWCALTLDGSEIAKLFAAHDAAPETDAVGADERWGLAGGYSTYWKARIVANGKRDVALFENAVEANQAILDHNAARAQQPTEQGR